MWPKKKDTEALLDLGERKQWTEQDRADAVRSAASWLEQFLSLSVPAVPAPPREALAFEEVKTWATSLKCEAPAGVGKWIGAVASATGSSAKSLSNQVAESRSDWARTTPALRWLCVIENSLRERVPTDAVWFHRRTARSIEERIAAHWHETTVLDAADAVLSLSLIALWQRRRDTSSARANRRDSRPRSQTPLPCGRVGTHLLSEGQFTQLIALAQRMSARAAEQLVAVAIETALTAAHFEPHRVRIPRKRADEASVVPPSLECIESALGHAKLGDDDRQSVRFRIESMRAFKERRPLQWTREPHNEYVRAAIALDPRGLGESREPARRFSACSPGLVMLIDRMRRHDLLE